MKTILVRSLVIALPALLAFSCMSSQPLFVGLDGAAGSGGADAAGADRSDSGTGGHICADNCMVGYHLDLADCSCVPDSAGTGGANGLGGSGGTDAGGATTFPCGDKTCEGTQYCHVEVPGPKPLDGGPTAIYSCLPVPATCAASPNCQCIASVPDVCVPGRHEICGDNGQGAVTVTCPGD